MNKTNLYTRGQSFVGIIIVTIVVLLIGGGLFFYLNLQTHKASESSELSKTEKTQEIKNFEECVAMGYQVLEGAPRQCNTPEGLTFTEEAKQEEPITPPQNSQEKKEQPKITCNDECAITEQKKCTNNGYQTCGDFNNDTCLEWSSITACSTNTVCQNGNCIQQKCSDGTLYSQCSSNKPFYCDNGNLINKCSTCGCLSDAICQDGVCIQKKTVAILIDKDTYSKIAEEIDQYSSDVQEELNVNVKLISEDWKINQIPDPQIFGVKDKLKDLYKNNGLLGAVIIGNVPMVWFDSEGTLTGGQTGDYVSDYWYMNIDGTFQDTDGDGMFNWKMNYHLEQESLPEIWIGRIKPPVVGEEGINLLKSYFDRNHKYRTGKLPNNEKLLWLHTIALAEENTMTTGGDLEKWYKESGVYDSVNWSKVWKIENIDIVFDNSGDKEERLKKASQEYLNKLQNNQYEFVAYSGHGTESYQEYGISSEDIKSIKPKVYFGVFTSCSLGDYSSENYIGGWYLFAGNGLAMMMRTFPSLGSAPNIQDLYLLVNGGGLNQRKTFGEAFKYHVGHVSWQATTLLGDPTLKLRY
jgi:hypothetical protein